jgi:hypothetical protein
MHHVRLRELQPLSILLHSLEGYPGLSTAYALPRYFATDYLTQSDTPEGRCEARFEGTCLYNLRFGTLNLTCRTSSWHRGSK